VTSGGTLAPAVMDPMMNDNLEDAKAVSDDELTADSDLIKRQFTTKESKEFQEFNLEINNGELWESPATMAKFLDKYFQQVLR